MHYMGFFRKKPTIDNDLHPDKKSNPLLKSACEYCGGKGTRVNKLEIVTIHERELTLHSKCAITKKMETNETNEREKIIKDARLMEKQEKRLREFYTISYSLDSGLEAILVFDYSKPTQSKIRLFFSKENNITAFSRDYLTNIQDNVIHFKIEPTTRKNAKMISGGNFDFNDSFDDGYSLVLNLKYGDQSLRKEIIDILREEGFGCLSADFTIHAHLNHSSPNESGAKEILAVIVERIRERISLI